MTNVPVHRRSIGLCDSSGGYVSAMQQGRCGAASGPGWAALVWLLFLVMTTNGTAFAADPVRSLRWGADAEGGGPYVFPSAGDPGVMQGFEVDLAAALAKKLGIASKRVQVTWDQILPELTRGDIDVAINGIEVTAEREEHFLATLPYYKYELAVCYRRNDGALADGFAALSAKKRDGRRWRVGVLSASSADRFVTEKLAAFCDVVRFEGSAEQFRLLEQEQLDASVVDSVVCDFYFDRLQRHPALVSHPQRLEPGYYAMFLALENRDFAEKLNAALMELHDSGELKEIYTRYGVWNPRQEQLPAAWATWKQRSKPAEESRFLVVGRYLPMLFRAAGVTAALACLSMPMAMAFGLLLSMMRNWNLPVLGGSVSSIQQVLRLLAGAYIEVVRGTPLAFQLFVIYFLLPELGLKIPRFWAAVIALSANYAACEAEIFRSGFQTLVTGQMEAALSLGMTRWAAIRKVILPQVFWNVIPAVTNDFIALFKDTAVCSVIAVEELSKEYSMGAKSTGLYWEMAAIAAVLYLVMSHLAAIVSRALEMLRPRMN